MLNAEETRGDGQMIEIAGGIILGIVGLAVVIVAVIYWPITIVLFILGSLSVWLHVHGWIK